MTQTISYTSLANVMLEKRPADSLVAFQDDTQWQQFQHDVCTLILLCSGAACTWAHHALAEEDNREDTKWGLILAVGLGVLFTAFQIREYAEAAFSFSGNVYGAIFFMATGFHGVHVVIGTIFLLVCLLRIRAGQMSREQHVGFEAAAWYWHFVDVVWLFLFASIYIWGS